MNCTRLPSFVLTEKGPMKIAGTLLGLLQGESLIIHMVPDDNAIKVTAKFIRPNADEQGTTRTVSIKEAQLAPDEVLGRAIEDSLAELRKLEPRVM
jgi:hypothetical protein